MPDDCRSRLLAMIHRHPGPRLPATAEISRELGIPRKQVLHALRTLRDEGLLEFNRGTPVWIAGRRPRNGSSTPRRPSRAVLESILESVRGGVYEAGQRMPKRAFLASRYGVSIGTIASVLRQLASLSAIHKKGKCWIVGKPSDHRRGSGVLPVIVLVTQARHSWRSLATAPRTRDFASTFNQEAINHGVQLVNVIHGERRSYPSVVRGAHDTVELCRELGERYLGAVLATPDLALPELRTWVDGLRSVKKKIVWFDPYGTESFSPDHAHFTRCRFDERPALRLAMKTLVEQGHSRIAYINGHPSAPWARARGERLAAIASSIGADLRIVPEDRGHLPGALGDEELSAAFLRIHANGCTIVPLKKWLAETGGPATQPGGLGANAPISEFVNELVEHRRDIPWSKAAETGGNTARQIAALTPTFLYAARKTDCSAILCSNDDIALKLYLWGRAAGIRIPEDISLLSFDNSLLVWPAPISSIDFGFGYLGYMAFHLLLDDIPLDVGRKRTIISRPSLVDRGSILRAAH